MTPPSTIEANFVTYSMKDHLEVLERIIIESNQFVIYKEIRVKQIDL